VAGLFIDIGDLRVASVHEALLIYYFYMAQWIMLLYIKKDPAGFIPQGLFVCCIYYFI